MLGLVIRILGLAIGQVKVMRTGLSNISCRCTTLVHCTCGQCVDGLLGDLLGDHLSPPLQQTCTTALQEAILNDRCDDVIALLQQEEDKALECVRLRG